MLRRGRRLRTHIPASSKGHPQNKKRDTLKPRTRYLAGGARIKTQELSQSQQNKPLQKDPSTRLLTFLQRQTHSAKERAGKNRASVRRQVNNESRAARSQPRARNTRMPAAVKTSKPNLYEKIEQFPLSFNTHSGPLQNLTGAAAARKQKNFGRDSAPTGTRRSAPGNRKAKGLKSWSPKRPHHLTE